MQENPLNVQMREITDFIKAELNRRNNPNCHWAVCERTANQFNLWDETENEGVQGFPLWLSYIVQDIGRDEGVL